ncbi:hypothetical protein DFH29DRAFT_997727 [Suillus ampliporus]|nr:hypothetical protein DFH29DRAFT_997727 [Suillus ampliporus]
MLMPFISMTKPIPRHASYCLSFSLWWAGKGPWFTAANGIIRTGIATIMVLEYSAFLQHDDELEFIKSAVDYYMKSPATAVVEKVATDITDRGYNKEELKKKIIEFILENRMFYQQFSKDLIAKK